MKIFCAILLFFAGSSVGAAGEIIKFNLFDGESVDGKLSLPANIEKIKVLVIFVHGTGPATYDNRRKFGTYEFNYFDYFANEFNRRGIAFFTYNKRGVTVGDTPPLFDKVDRVKYRTAIPQNEARDIGTYIKVLKSDARLKKAKIVLLGWSEGTIIAPMAALDRKNDVDALFLCGYVHDNMWDVIQWQNSGASAMITFAAEFDANKDGKISREEYESDDKNVAEFRTKRLKDVKFDQFDLNRDKSLTAADFRIASAVRLKQIRDAVVRDDEDWIWNNYFRVSNNWMLEHFGLEPNKSRMMWIDKPVYIFHGDMDVNCPVRAVYDLRKSYDFAKKKNLREFVFSAHNHDLNFIDWVITKEIPEGLRKIFDTASEINK